MLLQNELITEVDYKQYKITKKGKEFIDEIDNHTYEETITIPIMTEYIDDFKYFNLEFRVGYPTSKDEVEKLEKYLKQTVYEEWEKICKQNYPELLEETPFTCVFAFLNTILEDPNTPQKIRNMQYMDDLIYAIGSWYSTNIKLTENIHTKEIYKYIERPQVSDIVKLAASNCAYIKAK